jgi:hypothetical protein
MSRVNPYASIEKRTFGSALMHLLETEYGLLGEATHPAPYLSDRLEQQKNEVNRWTITLLSHPTWA